MLKHIHNEGNYLSGSGDAEVERDGAQHNGKRATIVTELAEGSSSLLPTMCRWWRWMASMAWAE